MPLRRPLLAAVLAPLLLLAACSRSIAYHPVEPPPVLDPALLDPAGAAGFVSTQVYLPTGWEQNLYRLLPDGRLEAALPPGVSGLLAQDVGRLFLALDDVSLVEGGPTCSLAELVDGVPTCLDPSGLNASIDGTDTSGIQVGPDGRVYWRARYWDYRTDDPPISMIRRSDGTSLEVAYRASDGAWVDRFLVGPDGRLYVRTEGPGPGTSALLVVEDGVATPLLPEYGGRLSLYGALPDGNLLLSVARPPGATSPQPDEGLRRYLPATGGLELARWVGRHAPHWGFLARHHNQLPPYGGGPARRRTADALFDVGATGEPMRVYPDAFEYEVGLASWGPVAYADGRPLVAGRDAAGAPAVRLLDEAGPTDLLPAGAPDLDIVGLAWAGGADPIYLVALDADGAWLSGALDPATGELALHPIDLPPVGEDGWHPGGYIELLAAPTAPLPAPPAAGTAPPVALFDLHAPHGGTAAEPLQLVDTGSHDPDGALVALRWDLGDGTVVEGAYVEHLYAAPGTYTVTYTVTDDTGMETSATRAFTLR